MTLRAAVVALLLLVAGCDAPAGPGAPIACAAGAAIGQGSSAQTNAINAWIKDYQIACPDATIEYNSSGSGAGVRAFLAGTGDFAGTDIPLTGSDQQRADARCGTGQAIHLPLVIGPIALAHNVAGIEDLRLSPPTIAKIFSGRVTTWNDTAIIGDNPGRDLPATRIRVVHRSDASGTTDNFLRYLTAAAPADWPYGTGGEWPLPGGLGQRGSHRVAAAIARTDGAIGYVESSYARVNDLATATVGTTGGEFAAPVDHAVALTVATARVTGDLRLEIDHAAATGGAYPIVQVTYELLCRPAIPQTARSFLAYAASDAGQRAVERAGHAPLPASLRSRVAQALASSR